MAECLVRTAYAAKQTTGNIVQTLMKSHQEVVTVFGRDNGKWLKRLRRIQKHVQSMGLRAVLIRDISDQRQQTLEEKAMFWALSSRFVILEDSVPTGHLIELKDLQVNRVTTVVLREKGCGSTYMSAALDVDFRFMHELTYTPGTLHRTVEKAVKWAKKFVESKSRRLDHEYRSWRPPLCS